MYRQAVTIAALALAGCAAPEAAPDPRAAQERACVLAVAEHVGMDPAAMNPELVGETASGNATFMVHHGGDRHSCEVGADGRVRALGHPRE